MGDRNNALAVKLMLKDARQYIDATNCLEKCAGFGTPVHILNLVAFEIMLKCVLLIYTDEKSRSHKYDAIFKLLPEEVRQEIVKFAEERMGGTVNYSELETYLKAWEHNFLKIRYSYEKYDGLTEAEYIKKGDDWIAGGARNEDATFVFYPEELFGLLCSMEKIIKKQID